MRHRALAAIATFVLELAAGLSPTSAQSSPSSSQSASPIDPDSVAAPLNLPSIGKWMIDSNGTVAHWLGQMVNGKRLYEPVNVILVDPFASSAEDARTRLLEAMTKAGYPVRFGHSAGYRGLIGGDIYPQMPAGRDDAFSNGLFEESNNHGRIFGPYAQATKAGFVFIGAFSRERVDLFEWPGHRYASFKAARDDVAAKLVALSGFQPSAPVSLGNALAPNLYVTTGDHDGRAVLLTAER